MTCGDGGGYSFVVKQSANLVIHAWDLAEAFLIKPWNEEDIDQH